MTARSTESGLLEILDTLLYQLAPASRSRFVGCMQTTAALLERHAEFGAVVHETARSVLENGPDGGALATLYDRFHPLFPDEQAKILELASRNKTSSGSLEDELIAWDLARNPR